MKITLLLLSLFILSACEKPTGGIILRPTERIKKLRIEAQTQAYLDSFETLHGRKVDDLEMSVQTLDPVKFKYVLGYCEMETVIVEKLTKREEYKTPKIVLNATYWNNPEFHAQFKEELVFHELGHCILKRGHDSRLSELGIQLSIMYPYHLGLTVGRVDFYSRNYEYYMNELFSTNRFAWLAFDDSSYSSEHENMDSMIASDESNPFYLNMEHEHGNCVKDKGIKIINENWLE